jgi:outer membrane receptor protein involved in Fe transport
VAPAITYNSNAIPMGDVQHFEVLLDGASALYGSDAVAGVINVITKKDMQDARLGVSAGGVDGTHYNTSTVTLLAGHDFFGGRANVTASFTWTQETALFSADQAFTATANKAGLFANTGYAGLTSLNFTNATSPWGTFTVTPAAAVNAGAASLTTSSGTFHIQPALNAGCAYNLAGGICIGAGPQATATTALNTRSDPEAAYPITITPAVNRYNFFSNARYDVRDSLTLYAEAGWYQAETTNLQPPTSASGSSTLTIPASNYWNPFGPVTFDNGQTNPNRLPGLNIPASGSAVTISSYQFADQGTNVIRDWGHQGRILLGAKGEMFGFHWDSALLYSDAANRDVGQGINTQQLQANLALSTPAAYNPFLGGNVSNPGGAVTNTANAAALQSFTSRYQTDAYSTLALWDFKVSKADLFSLPAGDVGMALGLEARHEFMSDMRDPTINGMTQFTDTVTGATTVSDELGVSQTPNTHGERWVESAYAEVAVPLVSPEMNVPLMERLDLQIAGRVENFSDVGGVGKPKIAFSWDVVDSLRLRGSWAQGFEAPNLIQEHETLLTRSNTNTDYVLCAADLASGRINSFANCSEAVSVTSQRYGNTGLKPQTSDSKSIGMVFQPAFVPAEFGNVILTGDYWEILEKNLIGVFGPSNALILDYALRELGSSNPNVVRAAPTVTQVAQFAGTGLTPVGTLLYVNDQYVNLNRQSARGIDLTAHWDLRDTDWGSFSVDANVARMIGLYLQPSPVQQQLLNYKASGVINAGTAISTFGNLLQQNSNPKIRWTLTPTWNFGPLTLGGQIIYTGQVYDTALINTSNVPFKVPSQTTGNVYAEWNFADGLIGNGTKVRVGARNVSNAAPPPFLNAYGFIAGLYEPYGRYTYVSLTERF